MRTYSVHYTPSSSLIIAAGLCIAVVSVIGILDYDNRSSVAKQKDRYFG